MLISSALRWLLLLARATRTRDSNMRPYAYAALRAAPAETSKSQQIHGSISTFYTSMNHDPHFDVIV